LIDLKGRGGHFIYYFTISVIFCEQATPLRFNIRSWSRQKPRLYFYCSLL